VRCASRTSPAGVDPGGVFVRTEWRIFYGFVCDCGRSGA
jgi:hypothetical protein